MSWIKLDHVTPEKPEVFRMAERLGIDHDAVVGKLVRVWIWADQQTISGDAPSVTRALADFVARLDGFAEAMIEVGWLVETESGLEFPNFEKNNGQTAKRRALTAKRNASMRANARRKRDAPGVTPASPRGEEEGNTPKSPSRGLSSPINNGGRSRPWPAGFGDLRAVWGTSNLPDDYPDRAAARYGDAVAELGSDQAVLDAARAYAEAVRHRRAEPASLHLWLRRGDYKRDWQALTNQAELDAKLRAWERWQYRTIKRMRGDGQPESAIAERIRRAAEQQGIPADQIHFAAG